MGQVIAKGKDSITINLGLFELAVFVEGWSRTIAEMYESEDQDIEQIMALLLAIEPFIQYGIPETKKYLMDVKEDILNPSESEENEEVIEEPITEENNEVEGNEETE